MILVSGASGFVGSAVARRLIEGGQRVRALVRPSSDRRNLDGLDLEVMEGDLGDKASLVRACEGCEGLFHVAADYRLWTLDPSQMFKTNVDGARSLMEAAKEAGVGRIVYTSSVATLGIPKDGSPGDEETPVSYSDMIGPYKQSKFRAEEVVRRMIAKNGLGAVIVNPSTPIGPRDVKPTPTGRMVVQAASGRMPAYVDTGLNVVHVDDVADGHIAAFEKGKVGERYVLGGQDLTLKEILDAIAGITGRAAPKIQVPHGLIMPVAAVVEGWARLTRREKEPFVTIDGVRMARKKMFFSSAKARRELGDSPRPAVEALRDAVAWFKDNGYLGGA